MIVNETAKDGKTVERVTFDVGRVKTERDSGAGLVVVEDRPMTAFELAEVTSTENQGQLEQRIRQALTQNGTFLAIGTPSAAQQLAQLRSLTRQVSALIRREFGDYTAVD